MSSEPVLSSSNSLLERFRLEAEYRTDHTLQWVQDRAERRKVSQTWHRARSLGGGTFGQVFQERLEDRYGDWQYRAIKVCPKAPMRRAGIDYERELSALASLSTSEYSGLFVYLNGWWMDNINLYISLEYLGKGDLTRYIEQGLTEQDAQDIVKDILKGLKVLHENGITHRDIKPQNILVVQRPPDSPKWWVKIADFGISKRILEDSTTYLHTSVGSPAYCAPEVIDYLPDEWKNSKNIYTTKVDMWSLGCVLFNIGTRGQLPFTPAGLVKYCNGISKFHPGETMASMSKAGISLTANLLQWNPNLRPSAADALKHPWFTTGISISQPPEIPSSSSTLSHDSRRYYNSFLQSTQGSQHQTNILSDLPTASKDYPPVPNSAPPPLSDHVHPSSTFQPVISQSDMSKAPHSNLSAQSSPSALDNVDTNILHEKGALSLLDENTIPVQLSPPPPQPRYYEDIKTNRRSAKDQESTIALEYNDRAWDDAVNEAANAPTEFLHALEADETLKHQQDLEQFHKEKVEALEDNDRAWDDAVSQAAAELTTRLQFALEANERSAIQHDQKKLDQQQQQHQHQQRMSEGALLKPHHIRLIKEKNPDVRGQLQPQYATQDASNPSKVAHNRDNSGTKAPTESKSESKAALTTATREAVDAPGKSEQQTSLRREPSECAKDTQVLEPYVFHHEGARIDLIDVSPNGMQLVTCLEDNSILLWAIDTQTLKLERTIKSHMEQIVTLAFSRTGKYIASSGTLKGYKRGIECWDSQTGKRRFNSFYTHLYSFTLSFTLDDCFIIFVGGHDAITLVDMKTGKGHTRIKDGVSRTNVCDLRLSPDGRLLWTREVPLYGSTRRLGTWKIWNFATGTLVKALDADNFPQGGEFSSDSSRFWSADDSTKVVDWFWSANTAEFEEIVPRKTKLHSYYETNVCSAGIAVSRVFSDTADIIWDLKTRDILAEVDEEKGEIGILPQRKLLKNWPRLIKWYPNGKIKLYDLSSLIDSSRWPKMNNPRMEAEAMIQEEQARKEQARENKSLIDKFRRRLF